MELFSELHSLMSTYRFAASRKIGQNFVISENLIKKIVDESELKPTDVVLEIGAGTGFLTRELLKHSKVIAVEIDDSLFELLKQSFAEEIEEKKLVLLHGNFLHQELPYFNKVAALPPYNISSDMMFKLLEHEIDTMVLVMQREFIFKAISQPGFKDFSPLAVMLDHYFESKIVMDKISPEHFFPSPKAFSAMLKLSRKKTISKIKNEEHFVAFLKHVFRYKNKNLQNSLSKSYHFLKAELGITHAEFEKKVDGIKEKGIKVYLVETQEFVDIFNKLFR